MKLKLDLHPIFNDTNRIETSLREIIDEAVEKRATEVEIIPGKGSGALKKSVLRFLDQPEIKSKYHRLEKDGDNWGRLFVHFRHNRSDSPSSKPSTEPQLEAACACCREKMSFPVPEETVESVHVECPFCGSPNRVLLRRDRKGRIWMNAELDYGE